MKKFKKIIRAVLVLAVLAGLIYLIPKVITVVRLKRAADSYVAASSVSTLKIQRQRLSMIRMTRNSVQ